MKTAYGGFVLAAALVCASCGELYNGQSGEGTFVYIPPEGAAVPAADSSFAVPEKFPSLGSARIGAYNASGKIIRETSGGGKLEFTLPAGGPYWLDFSAPVIHDSDPETDPFPFVKSFGATVKIEKVTAGSSREISLPLRVRETAIMVPYAYNGGEINTKIFVFYELPAQYPALNPPYFDKGTEEICFDFDPFGRLFTMEYTSEFPAGKYVYRRDPLSPKKEKVNIIPSSTGEHGLAFNVLNGRLYYAYLGGTGLNQGKYVLSEYDGSQPGIQFPENENSNLSSAHITIDDEGFLYGLTGVENEMGITFREQGAYWEESSSSLFMRSITEKLLEIKEGVVETISGLKALNGYLYILFTMINGNGYCAAVPLESVRAGTLGGAWFAGGTAHGEQTGAPDPFSTAGFSGPKNFAGWGPDRIYIYDVQENGADSVHRIVELNLRDRKISKAGLVEGYSQAAD